MKAAQTLRTSQSER